jgi:hypothetical protein
VKLIGELIEVISRRAGLDNVREVGESLKTGRRSSDDQAGDSGALGGRVTDMVDVVGSDLLDFGQLVIAGMKRTTGQDTPDTGARFGQGHSGFTRVGETLGTAGPNDSWVGSGSRAYADQNARQQLRTDAMAGADLEVHRVLFREAAQVTLRRGFLDDQSDFLAYTSYATFPLQFIPRYGEAAKLAIEMSALQGALGESAHQLYQLHSEVSANAAELQQAVGRYSSVADNAELLGGAVEFTPVPQPPPDNPPPAPVGQPAPPPATPPPAGAAGSLGSLIGSIAGALTGAAIAAGQRTASKDEDADEEQTDDTSEAQPGPAAERAPVDADPDGLTGPLTARLNTDTSPVPPAGTSPQDTK